MICVFNRCVVLWLYGAALLGLLFACTPINLPQAPPAITLPTVTLSPSEPNQIRQRIPLPRGAGAVAFGDGSIWVVVGSE